MYISTADLEFLVHLENKLGAIENWSDDVNRLWELNEKLLKQRKMNNEKTRKVIAEKRKTDKNYARPKNKGIE